MSNSATDPASFPNTSSRAARGRISARDRAFVDDTTTAALTHIGALITGRPALERSWSLGIGTCSVRTRTPIDRERTTSTPPHHSVAGEPIVGDDTIQAEAALATCRPMLPRPSTPCLAASSTT